MHKLANYTLRIIKYSHKMCKFMPFIGRKKYLKVKFRDFIHGFNLGVCFFKNSRLSDLI
jgi:hypothetical protein